MIPAYLRTPMLPATPRAHVPKALRDRVRELTAALEDCVRRANEIHADLTAATVEAIVVDYAGTAVAVLAQLAATPDAQPGVLDVLTRSAVESVPVPVDAVAWNTWLRRYTQLDLALVEGALMASYHRVTEAVQ